MVALCSELTSIDVSYCREITSAFLKAALDSVKIRTNKIPLKVKVAGEFNVHALNNCLRVPKHINT